MVRFFCLHQIYLNTHITSHKQKVENCPATGISPDVFSLQCACQSQENNAPNIPCLTLSCATACSAQTSADFLPQCEHSDFTGQFSEREDKCIKNERGDLCHLGTLPRRADVIVQCNRISLAHAALLHQASPLLPAISALGILLSLRRHLHREFTL